MAGTNGTQVPGHPPPSARRQSPASTKISTSPSKVFRPIESRRDPHAYLAAMDELEPGDIVTVFTPDDTHFAIAMEAVDRGLHVLVAKPIVKTLEEHLTLADAARRNGVLVAMEVHKRWDPIYADARDRIRQLGDFSFFSSFMSQPKYQLETFRSWAGKSSDISYYLNAHHIDFNVWSVSHVARPMSVTALASAAWRERQGIDAEDTITLGVQWENIAKRLAGLGVLHGQLDRSQERRPLAAAVLLPRPERRSADRPGPPRLFAGDRCGRLQLAQPAVHEVHARCPRLFLRSVGLRLPQHRSLCRRGRASPRPARPGRPIFAAGWPRSTTPFSSPQFWKRAGAASTRGGQPHQIEYAGSGNAVALSVA